MTARIASTPDGAARIAGYLRAAGLAQVEGHEEEVALAIADFLEAMSEKVAIDDPSSLYAYPVPMLSEDGTCSVRDEMAPVPYDLAGILGGRSEQATRRLALLERLVERAQETTGSDWVGIYQRRMNTAGLAVLVKLSYVGRASRAEFPLTQEFAAGSTNSTVGLTGRALVIDDVKYARRFRRRILRLRRRCPVGSVPAAPRRSGERRRHRRCGGEAAVLLYAGEAGQSRSTRHRRRRGASLIP